MQSSYSLVVEAKDRDGELGGNAATCAVEIKILDVNDNLPVIESHAVSTFITVFGTYLPVSHCLMQTFLHCEMK